MDAPKWHEMTVALPTGWARDELTVTPVRFRGPFAQVLDSQDFELPSGESLITWLAELNDLANMMEDATISYAEPFRGGIASDISLVVTGWRAPNDLEQEVLLPLLPKPE